MAGEEAFDFGAIITPEQEARAERIAELWVRVDRGETITQDELLEAHEPDDAEKRERMRAILGVLREGLRHETD